MLVKKPWGFFNQLVVDQTCSVKLITILPNQQTSLHYHHLRDDVWVILADGLEVQIGEEVHKPSAGEEFVIPAEKKHRIISKEKGGRVLEIAFGHTDEKDIIRLEDEYGRLGVEKDI